MQSPEIEWLIYQIELKRKRMEEHVEKYGLDHPLVLYYSQALDRLLNQYHQLMQGVDDNPDHGNGRVKESIVLYALA